MEAVSVEVGVLEAVSVEVGWLVLDGLVSQITGTVYHILWNVHTAIVRAGTLIYNLQFNLYYTHSSHTILTVRGQVTGTALLLTSQVIYHCSTTEVRGIIPLKYH